MIVTLKEKQREEAMKRIKKWELLEAVSVDFRSGILNCSERIELRISHVNENKRVSTMAKINWLSDAEKKIVKEFEGENESLVYHIVKTRTTEGLLYTLLYVSKYEDEWELDWEDLNESCQVCYTYPVFCPVYAERGLSYFKQSYGGLLLNL